MAHLYLHQATVRRQFSLSGGCEQMHGVAWSSMEQHGENTEGERLYK